MQHFITSPTTTIPSEVITLAHRLKLSGGDLLQLAREVSEDDTLRSIVFLNSAQMAQLASLMEFLAEPVVV